MHTFLIGFIATFIDGSHSGKYLTMANSAYDALNNFDRFMREDKKVRWIDKRWFIN